MSTTYLDNIARSSMFCQKCVKVHHFNLSWVIRSQKVSELELVIVQLVLPLRFLPIRKAIQGGVRTCGAHSVLRCGFEQWLYVRAAIIKMTFLCLRLASAACLNGCIISSIFPRLLFGVPHFLGTDGSIGRVSWTGCISTPTVWLGGAAGKDGCG